MPPQAEGSSRPHAARPLATPGAQRSRATPEATGSSRPALRPTRRAGPADAGQATVEAVAVLPLLVLVALAIGQVLAARSASSLAGGAAEAAAVAILQNRDPRTAGRDAVPGWPEHRVRIRVDGRRITVRLHPRTILPGLAGRLTATATADAGPAS